MNLARKLLSMDVSKYKELKTGEIMSNALSEALDEKVIVAIKQLDDERLYYFQSMMARSDGTADISQIRDVMALICAEGVTDPDLGSTDLQKYFGAASPKDLAKILFKGDDLINIGTAISGLSEYTYEEKEDLKN